MNSMRIERIFFAALLAVVVYCSYIVLGPYAGVLVMSGTLAILFRPLYRRLARFLRSESGAAGLCILIATLIIIVPLVILGVRAITEATTLYQAASARGGFDFSPAVHDFMARHFPSVHVPDFTLNFNDSVRRGLTWLMQNLGSLFSGVSQAFFFLFLSLFGLFYFLKDGARLKGWILDFIPFEAEYTEQIIHETELVMGSVIKGTLIVSVIQGIVVGVGFLLFGIPNPAFWGGLTMIASVIPIIGTWLVVVPAIGYLFFVGHGASAIGFAIWSIALVNVVYNIVSPQIIHRGANIHPFIILLSIIGGIGAFGPIGLLMGPFIIALLFALMHVYPKLVKNKK